MYLSCRMLKILIMTYPSVLLSSRLYGSVSVQTKPLKSRIHSFVRVPPSRCLDSHMNSSRETEEGS